MADRNVTVRLRAEVADFKRSMDEATKAVDKTSAAFDAQGQKIQTVSGRMVRSAQVNREAWTSTGMVLAGVAAGFGAVAVSVARTGIEYNTLQQTSRAALTTMLGSAEAANAQMDKLDEWARNSPFAKQVFIDAQRQMLGFGVEAEKVLPYLDAIQNAVAAMGGSNQEISEISGILAKIASQGKITARELMQLGIHGIDAATLIGSQMDMTGGQIREAITAGAIDATTALDALTAGMQERFGGAADNVKNTFEGAMDRVKAAWRDLAAELTAPLVGPEGGGILVDLANNLADLMRWFEALPEPIRNTVVGLGAVTGTAAALGAGFLLLFPKFLEMRRTVRLLSRDFPGLTAGMGKLVKGGAVVTGIVAGLALIDAGLSKLTAQTAGIESVTEGLLDLAGGADLASTSIDSMIDFGKFDAFLTGGGAGIDSMSDAIEELRKQSEWSLFGGIQDSLIDFTNTERLFRGSAVHARESMEVLDTALSRLASNGNADVARDAVARLGLTSAEVAEWMPQYVDALKAADNEQRLAADSAGELAAREEYLAEVQERVAESRTGVTDAYQEYREEVERWRGAVTDAFTSFVDNQGAFDAVAQSNIEAATRRADEVNEANARWAREQEGHVDYARRSWEDYYDGVTVAAADYIGELQAQVDAQQKWADNVTTVSERLANSFSGDELAAARENLEGLIDSGTASSGLVGLLAGASDSELEEIVSLWAAGGEVAGRKFTSSLVGSMDPFIEVQANFDAAQAELERWKSQEVVLDVSFNAPPTQSFVGGNIGNFINRQLGILAQAGAPGFYEGGPITGPGTATSDSIPIWASNGEYMQPAAAHSFWGTRAMESIRKRDVAGLWRELGARGFRDVGAVTAAAATPQIVTVPVESRYEEHAPLHMTFNGSSAFQDGMDYAERRRNSVLGGR